jgi:hypothetical protein
MKVTIPVTVWITNPAEVVTMDPDQPKEFFSKLHLSTETKEGLDYMKDSWLYIGVASCAVTLTESPDAIRLGAMERLQKKLQDLDAQHQKTRMAFEAALNKLSAIGWNGR